MNFKKGKNLTILKEMAKKDDNLYELNGIDTRDNILFFWREELRAFKIMSVGDYTLEEKNNNLHLKITNSDILDKVYEIQVCKEFKLKSSQYNDVLPSADIIVEKYNQLQQDVVEIIDLINKTNVNADTLKMHQILTELEDQCVWVNNKGNLESLPVGELYEKFDSLVNKILEELKKAISSVYENYKNELVGLGEDYKKQFIDAADEEIDRINSSTDLGLKLDKGGYNGTAQELFNLIKNYCPYQIGDIYQTTNKVNPSEIWQGTEWQRIEGRVLKGTSGERNSKETGGSNTVKLTVDNMPSHNHSATNSAHTHSSGNHNHYIFSSSIGGSHITDSSRKEHAPNYRAVLRNTTDRDDYVIAGSGGTANAGRTSSSSITIGSATPTTTIGSTGKGSGFSVENEYYTVHMWLRTK